jgi:adenosylhomocysteine nucleosidase
MRIHNEGVLSTGSGSITNEGGKWAIGRNARVESDRTSDNATRANSWNLGIITALSVEMRQVSAMLRRIGDVDKRAPAGGQRFHECRATVDGRQLKIVGTQTLRPGQRSAMAAFQSLRERYSPELIALIGIAGGVHPEIQIGDVVIAQEIVYYDTRKETPDRVLRRGQGQPVSATTMHAVNDFFAAHDQPCRIRAEGGSTDFQVVAGPIGSGEAVVADPDANIRKFLGSYNDKILALETEAGGVAQAFFEVVDGDKPSRGWLVIRGISDGADADKNDAFHSLAARHAAQVFEALLPYLVVAD